MFFSKEELAVLNMYSILSDQTTVYSDRIIVDNIEGTNDVAFMQYSDKVKIFTLFKDKKDCIDWNYDTQVLSNFVRLSKNDDVIEIKGESVKLGNNSSYEFKKMDLVTTDNHLSSKQILDLINQRSRREKITIKDVNNLQHIKEYLGPEEDNCNIYGLINNYFVACDIKNITGAVKTSSNINEILYFPDIFSKFISYSKLNEVDIYTYEENNLYMVQYGNSFLFFESIKHNEEDPMLPNIFDSKYKDMYYHPNTIIVNKKDVLFNLNKLNLITQSSLENRLFIKVNENTITIKNKDGSIIGSEEIEAKIDKNLANINEFAVSGSFLQSSISKINCENVSLRVPININDAVTISLLGSPNEADTEGTPKIDDSKIFILNLYDISNIDEG